MNQLKVSLPSTEPVHRKGIYGKRASNQIVSYHLRWVKNIVQILVRNQYHFETKSDKDDLIPFTCSSIIQQEPSEQRWYGRYNYLL